MKIVACILAALALSACDTYALIIGDSISHITRPEYVRQGTSTAAKVDAEGNRAAYYTTQGETGWQAVSRRVGEVAPNHWLVMELGTNDMQYTPPTDFRRFVKDVVAILPNDRCLAWVIPFRPDATVNQQFEDIIRAEVAAQPCRAFVEWDEWLKAYPGQYTYDGVHPNDAGTWLLACLVNQAMSKQCV